jgi:uncharacterized Zn finger protein
MVCPECIEEMSVVDSGDGTPCWKCSSCGYVMDYEPGDEGNDETQLEDLQIKMHEEAS